MLFTNPLIGHLQCNAALINNPSLEDNLSSKMQSYHTWPITKIMILLVFLASLTSKKVITLVDLREGYSQSYHGSKQQRVANIDHRILHAQIM